ncbi:inactive protein RESTRICTED TEV MOVEMENT 2-like, partial [Triticum dicoccoides]|uniref:inactive protein RESTRICTED TEV MOVEMENT 2-like n=1 Tax=Triticum dicoccoides TaxID=85692 RepID=UPI00188FCF27
MAAATGTKQQQQHPHPAPPPGATVVDPKFEWTERAGTYVLRLTLTGFRKDDFRVQVDGAGRLTIRGTRPGASLHKVFQLPSSASLDDIAGRFEAGVLTLTMPKRAGAPKDEGAPTEQVDGDVKTGDAGGEKKVPKPAPSGDAAPTSIEEIRTKPREEQQKAPQAAAAAQTPEKQAPNPTSSGKAMAVVDRERLAETVRRRGEEERAKAAAVAAAMEEARAEQEKKAAATACSRWKERMTE